LKESEGSRWLELIQRSLPLDYPPELYFYTYTTRAYEFITRWADGRSAKILAEVGCGSCLASICVKLAQPWKLVVACDVDPRVVRFAKQRCQRWRADVQLLVADARALPFKTSSFDSLLSEGLLEHYPEAERIGMLNEMERVAKRLLIDLPINQRNPGIRGGYGDEFLSKDPGYWRELFERCQLRVAEEYIREQRADGAIVRWGAVLE